MLNTSNFCYKKYLCAPRVVINLYLKENETLSFARQIMASLIDLVELCIKKNY